MDEIGVKKWSYQRLNRDWALLFDSKFKYFKANFTTHWLGPYEIEEIFDNRIVKIKKIDEATISFLVNGNMLKTYQ